MQKTCRKMLVAAFAIYGIITLIVSMAKETSHTTAVSRTTFTPTPIQLITTDTSVVHVSEEPTLLPSTQDAVLAVEFTSDKPETSDALVSTIHSNSVLASVLLSLQPTATLSTSFHTVTTSTLTGSSGATTNPPTGLKAPPSNEAKYLILGVFLITFVLIGGGIALGVWIYRKRSNRAGGRSSHIGGGVSYPDLMDHFRSLQYAAEQGPHVANSHQGLAPGASIRRMEPRDELALLYGDSYRLNQQAALQTEPEEAYHGPPTPPIPARSPLRPAAAAVVRPARPVSISASVLHYMDQNSPNVSAPARHSGADIELGDFSLTFPLPAVVKKKASSVYSA